MFGKITREIVIRIDAETEQEALFKANSLSIEEMDLLDNIVITKSEVFNFTSASDSNDLGEEF